MTALEVREIVASQLRGLENTTFGSLNLTDLLVPPRRIEVTERSIVGDNFSDQVIPLWLVAQTLGSGSKYLIVMSEDELEFGLAVAGGGDDNQKPTLVGFYGDLRDTFVGM